MIPTSKPRAPKHVVVSEAIELWRDLMDDTFPDFFLFGVRGYYRDSMGKVGVQERGIYDDAVFVVGPDVFAAFNANTDPSFFRKGVASLMPGWYPYRPGKHGISRPGGGYPAFRPATRGEALPVYRDGESGISKTPGIAIDIHRGGINTTSSAGCQTIHPAPWTAFHALVTMELKKSGLMTFYYGLIEGPFV